MENKTVGIPINPDKIIRLEGCYEHDVTDKGFNTHIENVGFNEMDTPSLWVAPNSTLTSHKGTVRIPSQMMDVRPGVELGIVIGSAVKNLDSTEALNSISGFTVCMDITVHDDIPGLEGYRMFDSCLPCGPEIIDPSMINPERCALGVRHNGNPVDVSSTTAFRFSIKEIVSYVSQVMSLSPGDLITTGTPIRGAPSVEDGDQVEAWIESIGTLQASINWEDE